MKRATPKDQWVVYFAYAPEGELHLQHIYTLKKLRDMSYPILLIVAAKTSKATALMRDYSDALIIKGLRGYDFSAYQIALRHLALHSPFSDVLVFNDSVFGPFCELKHFFKTCRWDIAGFTSSERIENHLQSYAFIIRSLNENTIRSLGSPFRRYCCFNQFWTVVLNQETRFARIASQHLKVGSFWHDGSGSMLDPSLSSAVYLVEKGFPFVKRSLIGKHHEKQDVNNIKDILRTFGFNQF